MFNGNNSISMPLQAAPAMTVTIDEYGRLVVPKEFRDRLGLVPGTELEIEEREGHLQLVPVENRVVRTDDGIPVWRGAVPTDFDSSAHLRAGYREQAKKHWNPEVVDESGEEE